MVGHENKWMLPKVRRKLRARIQIPSSALINIIKLILEMFSDQKLKEALSEIWQKIKPVTLLSKA